MKQLSFALITFLLSSIPIFAVGIKESILLICLHLIIALICSFSLFMHKNRVYSLHKMIHIFFLFFLCIAPIMQFKNNVILWEGAAFTEPDYILTTSIVLYIILVYNAVYYLIYKSGRGLWATKVSNKLSSPLIKNRDLTLKEGLLFMTLSCLALCFWLYINNFNLFALFFRGFDLKGGELLTLDDSISVSQPFYLIVANFLRPMAIILLLYAYKLNGNRYVVFFLVLMMVLVDFPTSMPRFSAAAMYIPVLLMFCKVFRKSNVFVLCIIGGLLILFPFFENFRHFSDGQNMKIGLDFKMLQEEHFDSYSSLLRVVKYDITTNGKQLLGCLFFWLPRSIWPSKPIGSGAYLSEKLDLAFDNISCCYFAEGYINAGFLGIVIFTVCLAIFSSMFDNTYWNNKLKNKTNENSFFEIFYFFLLGLIFFMMRGDLLSSFAYTVGFLVSVLFVYYILLYVRKYKLIIYRKK